MWCRLLTLAILAVVIPQQGLSFRPAVWPKCSSLQRTCLYSSSDDTARAMQEYMARTHEEKLKHAEEMRQKDREIERLKQQLEETSSGTAPAVAVKPLPPVVSSAPKDAATQLAAYQKFMSEYIVKAQEQKFLAVKEAEQRVAKKFEERLKQLPPSSTSPPKAPQAPLIKAAASPETALYGARNAKVVEAAQAGKSRWGSMETEKAKQWTPAPAAASTSLPSSTASSSASSVLTAPPPEVAEADRGLRADGSVGGLTLAERIMLGSQSDPTPATSTPVPSSTTDNQKTLLYAMRNVKLAKEGSKNTRWGPMEMQRAAEYAATASLPSSATGSQESKPVSLEDRVNLGARLLATA